MAQRFDGGAPRGEHDTTLGEVIELGTQARPLLNLSAPVSDPVPLIDLGSLATTAGERALAELIAGQCAMPVDQQLARASLDPQLYALLTRMDLDQADDETLVEAAAAAERLEAAAHAIKLRTAATLSHRLAMNPAALAHTQATQHEVAADELTVRLRITHRAGTDLIRRGRALEGVLEATGHALAAGTIDPARARAIIDGLEHVPPEVAATVEEQVLPRAPRRTVAQLRSDVARTLIAVDADAAAQRARHRTHQRRVSRPRAHGDDVASMRIEGPAADVLALDVALQGAARAAKTTGETRTIDQLRFDALAGIAHHALTTGHLTTTSTTTDQDTGTGTNTSTATTGNSSTCSCGKECDLPLATQHGHRPTIMITIPLNQLMPNWQPPPGTTSSVTSTSDDAHTGTDANDPATNQPDPNRPDSPTPTTTHDQVPTWPPPLPGEHLDPEQVPTLEGYGPITPALARALACGGDWYRIITDPLTGAVLDAGHTRYRPTQAMIDHILARDTTCVRPGCTHRARECQLDHTQEWNHHDPQQGGRTAVTNLAPLCGRDHQVKTHGHFHLTHTGPGTFEWTTPTGHHYRREPDGTTTLLSHPDHTAHHQLPDHDPDNHPSDGHERARCGPARRRLRRLRRLRPRHPLGSDRGDSGSGAGRSGGGPRPRR